MTAKSTMKMFATLRSACLTGMLGAFTLAAQPFEGTIEFTKTTGPVVTMYKYYVHGDHVRIEEVSDKGVVQGIMLIDNRDNTVTAISPDRKLYMDVPNMRLPNDVGVEIKKTTEMKQIAGYKCEKWVVIGQRDDRILEYWVAADEFDFFIPLLKTLNRKDEQAVYFLEIPGAKGVFPMMGMETKMDGTEISRLEVTRVERMPNKLAMFEILKGSINSSGTKRYSECSSKLSFAPPT